MFYLPRINFLQCVVRRINFLQCVVRRNNFLQCVVRRTNSLQCMVRRIQLRLSIGLNNAETTWFPDELISQQVWLDSLEIMTSVFTAAILPLFHTELSVHVSIFGKLFPLTWLWYSCAHFHPFLPVSVVLVFDPYVICWLRPLPRLRPPYLEAVCWLGRHEDKLSDDRSR